MNKYSKTAYIVEVIAVLVLGCLPGIIVLSTSKYQIGRFPPDTCFPSTDIIFHTFKFPFLIYATLILAMLFTVLRRVSVVSIILYRSKNTVMYTSAKNYSEPSQIRSLGTKGCMFRSLGFVYQLKHFSSLMQTFIAYLCCF